ncbi:MAG: DUF2247 family protein [Lachnospiraceae bacterium]|nr:DUF2247 family protein [Lachnospiraceae bacterium]
MEIQIKYFTNDLIDKLVVESKLPTNSLSIQIPFSYATELVNINWNDILFAVSNGYFDKNSAIEYAVSLLGNETVEEEVTELAISKAFEVTKEEILEKYVAKLACKEIENEKKEAKDKIMYILLSLLFENKEKFEDPLRAVEIVYADFGFPKSVEKFVRYMPIEDGESIGAEQMYKHWEDYLNSQKNRFRKIKIMWGV